MPLTHRISATGRSMVGGLPRPFWFIWAGTLINRCGSFVLPFMAIYLTEVRHLSLSSAGLVVGLYGLGHSFAGPLGGAFADHVGRRATMLVALGLGGAGMIALGFAERIDVIAPMFFLLAVVSEMYRPGMSAAIADLVPAADRPRAYGLIYWAINLGFAIGMAIGGVLAGYSFRWLFLGDGITTLLFALVIWLGVPETRPGHRAGPKVAGAPSGWAGFTAPYRDLTFVAFLGLAFLFSLMFMQNPTTLPLDMAAHGIPKATLGILIGLNGVVIVLVQPFLGPLLVPRDRSKTLAVGAVLSGIGFGVNAIAGIPPIYALGVVVWTIGEICVLPVASTVVADLAPQDLRGRYQGAHGLAWGLASCGAPVLGSLALQHLGSVTLWMGCLVLGLSIALGQLGLAPALRRARELRLAGQP